MKTLRKIGLAIMSVAALALTSACDSDDDKDGSSSGSGEFKVTLDGEKVNLSHAYWMIDDESTAGYGNHIMSLVFTSYDLNNPPKKLSSMNYVSIDYEVPKSQTTLEWADIRGGKYNVYVVQNVTMDDPGWQGENIYGKDPDGWFHIKPEDGMYTISLRDTKIYQESDADFKTLSFSYSGKLKPYPAHMAD